MRARVRVGITVKMVMRMKMKEGVGGEFLQDSINLTGRKH